MKIFLAEAPDGGPRNFISRLKDSIMSGHLADIETNPDASDVRLECIHNMSPECDVPYVLRLDGIYHDSQNTIGNTFLLNMPIYDAYKKAKGVIFQSEFDRWMAHIHFGEHENSIVINNGSHIKGFNQDQLLKQKRALKERVILASSKWRRHKRLKECVQAFSLLPKEYDDVEFRIAGYIDQKEQDELKLIVKDASKITFLGNLTKDQIYNENMNASVFLHLSWFDHCPNSVVEAMACGTPVVCSNQGGTRELIEKTNCGLVAPIDPVYDGGFVSLYSPPKVDLTPVKHALMDILNGSFYNYTTIDLAPIAIGLVARRYVEFLKECA